MNNPITQADLVSAARALGIRDIAVRGAGIVTLRTLLADCQRLRLDALHAAVAHGADDLDLTDEPGGATLSS